MTDKPIGRGTVLAGRFRLEDLVQDTDGARFWRAIDQTLARSVAVNVVDNADPRAEALLVAARTSATITEGHFLRVLDAAREDGVVYVVHEWGTGVSLDKMLSEGPLPPRRAAWLVKEVADAIGFAHSHGIAHGRLVPENVMVTDTGSVKLIGFVVDAVLHGRRQPATADGRSLSDHESDVYNLAALLYATLAGRWPGTQTSQLPEAPRDHGRTLRPRQVRAGVPRALDAICDQVLNPGSAAAPPESAHEISAALSDFIGDAAAGNIGHEPTVVIERDEHARFRPAQDVSGPSGTTDVAGDPEATRASSPRADPEETQAAEPFFLDDDTGASLGQGSARARSGEHRTRRVAPPPPPPLPEPASRPLFAPGPPRSTGATRAPASIPASGTASADLDRSQSDPGGGTGSLPPVWGPDAPPDSTGEDSRGWARDAGKDWLKLAGVLAAVVLLVLAVVFAFNLGRGTGEGEPTGQETGEPTGGASPGRPLAIAGVSDFDPPPDGNGEENGDLAALAVDGNAQTAWQTLTYYGNPELGGLKEGVGLVVDLGRPQEVSSVQVTLQGRPTRLEILAAPEGSGPPVDVDALTRAASAEGAGGRTVLDLAEPATTQYLVVWLTSLPPVEDGFRGKVAEIVVRP